MLRKLMRQEILASFRTYLPILAAIVGMTVMVVVSFRINEYSLLGLFSLSISMLIIGAAGGFTVYNLVVSLGTRVYGKPGYLLFSVPAKTWEILLSKFLINLMWLILTAGVCLGSLVFMFEAVGSFSGFDFLAMLEEILGEIGAMDYVRAAAGGLVTTVYQISFFMFLFSLLNLIYKGEKKVLIGILLYFGLQQIVGVLQNAVFGGTMLSFLEDPQMGNLLGAYWGSILLYGVLALVFFGLTYHFMDKKMELQ